MGDSINEYSDEWCGFDMDEPIYHGTMAGEFSTFIVHYRSDEQLGFGIHVTPDKAFAQRYADPDLCGRKGNTPYLFCGVIRKDKVLDATAIVLDGTPEFALAKRLAGSRLFVSKDENGVRCAYMQAAIDSTNPKRAEQIIKDAGYDTIQYVSTIMTRPVAGYYSKNAQALSYVVLYPENIRALDIEHDISTPAPMCR
jgi:hypothetical protein